MSLTKYDAVSPAAPFHALPLVLELSASRASAWLSILMLTPAIGGLALPLTMLAAQAVAEPSTLTAISNHPFAAVQIFAGLLIWTALFVYPLKRIVGRLGAKARITIADATVTVEQKGLFGSTTWNAPLASYQGVAHHVRATMSGLRHELVLVNPDPAKCLLVAVADRMPQATIDATKALLGLPEVPAKSLYARSSREVPALGLGLARA